MTKFAAPQIWTTIGVCFLTAVFEGLDIQSMGLAAPHLAPLFGLRPDEIGLAMSASTVGLMIGAACGGWLSDHAWAESGCLWRRWSRSAFFSADRIFEQFSHPVGDEAAGGDWGSAGHFPI